MIAARTAVATLAAAAVVLATVACTGGGGQESAPADGAASPSTAPVIEAIPTADDIELSSPDFEDGGELPLAIACETYGGAGESPALKWDGIPPAAANLVLVVHDPDAPLDGGFTHLLARFGPTTSGVEAGANENLNSPMGRWIPVCPPAGEEHRYTFTLYVFPIEVGIPARAARDDIELLSADAIGSAQITGRFAAPAS